MYLAMSYVSCSQSFFYFFFYATATTELYTLFLHDALPISSSCRSRSRRAGPGVFGPFRPPGRKGPKTPGDRKSTRLNSSHEWISYAVFCLKKKKKKVTRLVVGITTTYMTRESTRVTTRYL